MSIDSGGRVLVAWAKTLAGKPRVQARTRAADGTLSPITTLDIAGQEGADLARAALAQTGDVGVAVWRRFDGVQFRLQLRRLVGGTWQPVENVSPAGMDARLPRIGLSADGSRATIVFSTSDLRVRARTRAPDGTYGPVDMVSSHNGIEPERHELAVNGAGQAVAAWQQFDGPDLQVWTGASFIP